MKARITSDGRIEGTRISVHDIYYYLKHHGSHTEIALILGVFPDDILDAIHYIVGHRDAVEANYQAVEERNARGNPPEIEAKLQESRAKMQQWMQERRQAQPEKVGP